MIGVMKRSKIQRTTTISTALLVCSLSSSTTSVLGLAAGGISSSSAEFAAKRWFDIWEGGLKPGERFDARSPSPALWKLIQEDKIPNGRALIPGCGRGYDVAALASPHRYALGIDIVDKAVDDANTYLQSLPDNVRPPTGQGEVKVRNFFDLPTSKLEDKWNFVYDYTFLCALDPSIRKNWAAKMAELVHPNGELLTLVYPISETKEGGPPFRVSLQVVRELLEPVGFRSFQLEMLPPHLCHPGRDGIQKNLAPGASFEEAYPSGIGRWKLI